MENMKELIPVYESESRRVVDARDLHEFLGVGKDFSTWLKDRIEKYGFTEGEDYVEVFPNFGENSGLTDKGGRPTRNYLLSLDTAKELCMVENNEKGRQARKYFIAVEKAYRENQIMAPRDYAAALRAYADEVERREIAERDRDRARMERVWIGRKREATAMATASNAMQRCTKLEDELGNGKNWKQCTAMGWIKDFFEASRGMWSVLGRKMAALSVDMGYEVRKIENSSYGTVNAYHVSVWEEFRSRVESNPEMMWKYRKA